MKYWIELPSEEVVSKYGIPSSTASGEGNLFLGIKYHPRDMHSEEQFIAFITEEDGCVALHIRTLDVEMDEIGGESVLEQNNDDGFIVMSKPHLSEFINILENYSWPTPSASTNSKNTFILLDEENIKKFRMEQPSVLGQRDFYLQIRSCSSDDSHRSITIIMFNNHLNTASSSFFIEIFCFTEVHTILSATSSYEEALPKIVLDQRGLQDLAMILRSYLDANSLV